MRQGFKQVVAFRWSEKDRKRSENHKSEAFLRSGGLLGNIVGIQNISLEWLSFGAV